MAMCACAAVMTGQNAGAIATIQLFGDAAGAILRRIFRKKGGGPFEPTESRVLLGEIVEDGEVIDEVTLGCEGPQTFALHCHGNPLIVQRIVGLLQRQGVEMVPTGQLLARILASRKTLDAIAIEAKLAMATVKTLEGAAILANQAKAGLSEKVRQWRNRLDSTPLEEIAAEVLAVLKHSEPARWIIDGGTIALIGPPNTGKSTLLNALAGREKAIVSDIRGTTRDWVSAEIHLPPLAATIVDTAGLDPLFASGGQIDQAAHRKSLEILGRADLILLVLDLSQPAPPTTKDLMQRLVDRQTIVVLNKADLPSRLDPTDLPAQLRETVRISARQGAGIDDLVGLIRSTCGVTDFDLRTPVAFTGRQRRLLESLPHSNSKAQACSILSKLLESPVALPGS